MIVRRKLLIPPGVARLNQLTVQVEAVRQADVSQGPAIAVGFLGITFTSFPITRPAVHCLAFFPKA